MSDLITTILEADGLLLASIDMTDRTMNVFSDALMDALDELLNRVESDPEIKGVVLTSGKSNFLAGADLLMVRGYCSEARSASHERMYALCGRLGRQFIRLEDSSKPWVAAVNGLALGGGLELSMACRGRVVSDDRRIQLGLPEIRWGLLPGAGGTQRLPRMVGFDIGMELLLTGRSMSPDEAVSLGLFSKAVPAEKLLDEARQMARSMLNLPYDPASKFPHLDQSNVPEHSNDTARQLAQRFGISSETFNLYPAFSAIIDSVLKGARLPLAQANAIEMTQFLRLMFSPVAGRMVRILFLERLRAERELTAPLTAQIRCIRIGPLSDPNKVWTDAISKLKIEKSPAADLPENTLDIIDTQDKPHRVILQTLNDSTRIHANEVAAVLAPPSPYGRVMEILGHKSQTTGLLTALASHMRVLAWPSNGQTSLLQNLCNHDLTTQAAITLRWSAEHKTLELSFLDVAACLAGVSPGWTGGPLSWLWDEQDKCIPSFDHATLRAWAEVKPRLEKACA